MASFVKFFQLMLLVTNVYASEWVEQASSDIGNAQHELTFWLQPANSSALHAAIDRVSDPNSPSFRQYLDDGEIARLVAPSLETIIGFKNWLRQKIKSGRYKTRRSLHGDYFFVRAHAHDWSRVFGRPLAWYEHTDGKATPILRLAGLDAHNTLGSDIHMKLQGVRAVFGLSDFYPVIDRETSSDPTCKQFKGAQIDPNVIRSIYHNTAAPAPGTHRPGFGKHSQGIAAFEDAQFDPKDVAKFQTDYNLTDVKVSVLGPNNGGYYGEASLDTQYIFSTGSGVDTWFIAQETFDMLAWSFLVANMSAPPAVLSVSWGGGESNYDLQHQHAASDEFAKLGLKGHTIVAASGDQGTGEHGGLLSPCKHFDPTWPASSPYVTAVGGTYIDKSNTEVGWSSSGGGFSSNFPQPAYQHDQVSTYLHSTTQPPTKLFNASGRATPDVSAFATNYRVLSLGAYGCISGTSAATPVFAGMLSLLNDELISANKPTLGFINPSVYAATDAGAIGFDVTQGENKDKFCPSGFRAAVGFDAVTGLGTPEMNKLRSVLIK